VWPVSGSPSCRWVRTSHNPAGERHRDDRRQSLGNPKRTHHQHATRTRRPTRALRVTAPHQPVRNRTSTGPTVARVPEPEAHRPRGVHQLVATAFVPVADQDQALAFCTDWLGFEKRADFASGDGRRSSVRTRRQGKGRCPLLSTSNLYRTGGLAASPGSCRIIASRKPGPTEWEERNACVVVGESGRSVAMTEHAVVIAGGPTGVDERAGCSVCSASST
jgi:hypothetical protein